MEETIKICCDSLYKNQELLCNISKNQFEKLLRAALSNNYFLFDGSVYQQIHGVAMGSPLGPSLANAFLAHYEQVWLNDCPNQHSVDNNDETMVQLSLTIALFLFRIIINKR